MSNWPDSPQWTSKENLNQGKQYEPADGLTADDINNIVKNLLYLYDNGSEGGGGFAYTVNTSAEVTIPADDLEKIKADPNAVIVEVDTTRPSPETRFYKKGIDFIGGTVFVCIYTVVGEQAAEGCSIAYRGLDTSTGVLRARHETNALSRAEVRQEIEGKYLPKPSGNPTEDSLVKVSSAGTSSWQPVSDFLARPTSAANSDRVCIIPDGQTKFGYRNAYKTVYNVENVMVIRDVRGTVPQPDPQREQDGVNLRYLQANYNGNPILDDTEAELTGVTLNGTKYKVPSGGGAGIDALTDVNLTSSETTVAYDIASGVTVNSKGKFTYKGGEKEATTEVNVPIVAGKGTVIDKVADKEQVEVKVDINDAVKYGDKSDSISIGNTAVVSQGYGIAMGYHTQANLLNAIAIGAGAVSKGVAIGSSCRAGQNSISIGDSAGRIIGTTEEYQNSINIGNSTYNQGDNSIGIGYSAHSLSYASIAIGHNAECQNSYSVAIGSGARTVNTRCVAIGNGASCRNNIITAIGSGVYNDEKNSLIVFGAGVSGIGKNAFKIDTDYNAYAGEAAQRRLAFVDEVKPTDNPTEDSVVKISSTGGVSYEPLSSLGGLTKNSITLNLSEFTYDEDAQKFTLSQNAANTVLQIIQKAFELKGLCVAYLSIGGTPYASYQVNFSNELPINVGYISFSNPQYDSEDLSATLNVVIKPKTTAQRICSDTSLFNMFVENQGVLEFFFYSM